MRSKFGSIKSMVDGIEFDSRREAKRYQELKLFFRAGEIEELELQPKFPIVLNDVKVCTYIGDFQYRDKQTGKRVIEDVKSEATKTPIYRLKKKLVEALYPVRIIEV